MGIAKLFRCYLITATVAAVAVGSSALAGGKSGRKSGQEAGRASSKAESAVLPEARAAYADIQATLGSVPSFFKAYPQESISAAWEEMKSIQLNPDGAVPNKYRELIGLAVSSQIPCRYCAYFHTEAAKLWGATDREIREAVAVAGSTRRWSTVLYGNQIDEASFRADIDQIVKRYREKSQKVAEGGEEPKAEGEQEAGQEAGQEGGQEAGQESGPIAVTDRESAHQDIERTFGFVPSFLKSYPGQGLAGLWKSFKSLDMNPDTAIPGKYKDLISLGVGSQIPCQYCTYADTEFAKLDGATSEQIREAVAMSGVVRNWSTVINGLQVDEKTFRSEVVRVFRTLRARMKSKPIAQAPTGSEAGEASTTQ